MHASVWIIQIERNNLIKFIDPVDYRVTMYIKLFCGFY